MTPLGAGPGYLPDGTPDLTSSDRPGATVVEGGTRFEVWAPETSEVDVVIDPDGAPRFHRLAPTGRAGTFVATVAGAGHGTRYRYRLDGRSPLADPASRAQPDGVFGPSAVVDPGRFEWTDRDWRGVELAESVLYELHVGTFTPGGTLDAAIGQLARLATVGVTTIELMPLAQFAGERGWGYDGVFPAAVQHNYGGAAALARFVDAAHSVGLAVVLDVVHNHFGPEGSVLEQFGPYVTTTYATPWGGAVNVSESGSDQVRRLLLDSVRWFVDDLHLDGLRLDAVHAIVDPTARPFVEEVCSTVHEIGARRDRTALTFLESSANDPRMVTPPPAGVGGDAVWNDEYHHALRVALTGDRSGYYADYSGPTEVEDVLRHRFTYRGRWSSARGRRHGRPVDDVDFVRFVVFDQNHDQIGNRRDGERLGVIVGLEKRKLALAAVLLSPFTPMLFMGEEYGDPAPFPFFVDYRDPALRHAVREGRAAEFADFAWEADPPDPADPATFRSALLRPGLADDPPHRQVLTLTSDLLRHRREHAVVTEPSATHEVARWTEGRGETVVLTRGLGDETARLALRFGDDPGTMDADGATVPLDTAWRAYGGTLDTTDTAGGVIRLAPWSAVLAVTHRPSDTRRSG